MIIKVLVSDTHAQAFIEKLPIGTVSKPIIQKNVMTYNSNEGGMKTVGIYSVENSLMLLKNTKGKKLIASLYQKTEDEVTDSRQGTNTENSIKRTNKRLRQKLTPKELADCELYIVINRDQFNEIQFESIFRDLIASTLVKIPTRVSERGGALAYTRLPNNRLVTPSNLNTGNAKYVWYGTSGLHNIAELILTAKTAHILKLPFVFDSYGSAIKTLEVLKGFQTSLKSVGKYCPLEELELLVPQSEWNLISTKVKIDSTKAKRLFVKLGMEQVLPYLLWHTVTLDQWYREAMLQVMKVFISSKVTGSNISFQIKSTEDTALKKLMKEHMREIWMEVQRKTKYPVGVIHDPLEGQIRTDNVSWLNRNANFTLEELHRRGCHAGGYLIYQGFYSQSQDTSFVAILYDGSKGGVHIQAKDYMQDPYNLWVCPVGSYGIYPKTDSNVGSWNSNLDPWVFLYMIEVWEEKKSKDIIKTLWDYANTPLRPSDIGNWKSVFVDLDGIKIIGR